MTDPAPAPMVSSRTLGKYLARVAAAERLAKQYLARLVAAERLIDQTDIHVHFNADGSLAPECVLKSDLRQAIGVIYDGTEDNEQQWPEPRTWDGKPS